MRWLAQIRLLFSKSKCISVILASLCLFIVYTFTRSLPTSGFIALESGGRPSSGSSRQTVLQEDGFAGGHLNPGRSPGMSLLADDKNKSAKVSFSSPHTPGVHQVDFDPHGNDILVVLHTQKTGGSEFLRHLVTVKKAGQFLCLLPSTVLNSITDEGIVPKNQHRRAKRRAVSNPTSCPRDPSHPDGEQWLVAEKTVSWVCGLHASFTEYRNCLPTLDIPRFKFKSGLRLHYAILLRHPVLRYLSEYLHVQRGATWSSQRKCGGKAVSQEDMPPCYPGFYAKKPWPNLTLSSFVSCESNWGNNRQTMMLADLESVHCYDRSAMSEEERERRLLESAKANLHSLAFFGVTEYMLETCRLFETTFGVTFAVPPDQRNVSELHSAPMLPDLWSSNDMYQAILRANHLDVQLYDYALGLFSERAKTVGITVNKNLVEQAVEQLQANPHQVKRILEKYRRANYMIS